MIGARFSLYPMTNDFVPIILCAVEVLDAFPLERESDDISTFLSGEENTLFEALHATFAKASASLGQEHLVMSLTLSRGCPGEPGEDICDPVPAESQIVNAQRDGEGQQPQIACQFSLYPMGESGYMDAIYEEIEASTATDGVKTTPQHLCTRLEGSLAAVLGQLRETFDRVATLTPHVVIHATLSVNSPTVKST